MAKYKIILEVEIDTEIVADKEKQIVDAAKRAIRILQNVKKEDKLVSTSGKWVKLHRSIRPARYKCSEIKEDKPQVLDVKELHDIHSKVYGFDDKHTQSGWCAGLDISSKVRWSDVKCYQDALERSPKFAHKAKGIEAVLRRECDTREKLMRYRRYWRIKEVEPRGLDYQMLLLAMSNAIARDHAELHNHFSDIKDPWEI